MDYQEFKTTFNLDNTADRLDVLYFTGIDFDLLAQKMKESKTCLMKKRSSAYVIKNYTRIINDEMKDYPSSEKGRLHHFERERTYTKADLDALVDDINDIKF